MELSSWNDCVEAALSRLSSLNLFAFMRPIQLKVLPELRYLEVFQHLNAWDRSSVEVQISEATFHKWVHGIPSSGEGTVAVCRDGVGDSHEKSRNLLLFSGNDYLGLSSHPAVRKASAKAAQEYGMGPRGGALSCGYTSYHRLLELSLADLKQKEACLLCPTGFAANLALMTALGSMNSLIFASEKPLENERIAIFSDALNHASIIDGIRLAGRQRGVEVFVYKHCDMSHLNQLLSSCTRRKKVVVTDSLFSMDGDVAPMDELTKLRKKYGFLLVVDDAHGTFVYGKNGGGVGEEFNCESDIDICIGTLSKGAGCQGGFIACSARWKQYISSTGRSFIFSTAMPVPNAVAALAAMTVAKNETWRRAAIWNRVRDFQALTGVPVTSPIVALIVGTEEKAQLASRDLVRLGFHVIAITPPAVPANLSRLRVNLTAAHTTEDLKRLTTALSKWIDFKSIGIYNSNVDSKL